MRNNNAQQNIPNGWQEKKLADVCDIVNGSTPKRSVSEYWENGKIPWFTVDDIRSNGRIINKTNQSITDKALKETSVKLLPEDSVLLCCTASLGEVALTKIPLTTNQQFNGLVSKNKANLFPYYLFYSAQKLGEGLKSKSGKTTINFLSVGSLSKEKVLVPPIKEQQKIAEILGAVDEDIAKTQKVIEATEKLKRGLMQQLFGTSSETKKLGEITELITKGTTPTTYGHAFTDEGVNFFKIENIDESGNIDLNSCKHITEKTHQFLKRSQLAVEDVLFSIAGALGRVAVVNTIHLPANTNQAIAIIRLKEKGDSTFVSQVLRSDYVMKQVVGSSVQLAQANISLGKLGDVSIPWPNVQERNRISNIIQGVDEKISVNKKLKEKLTLLKKGLMQDLLSGNKRVVNLIK